ncbi:FkbM family methyltransferase [Merismopedia glauca]|uniref:Methyltransferase FkbM domain-containing protein n=1 Tax=Merismopedia glauca CCAP 1448/3 TaxID=1296344 RepID=A0A2T1C6B0_9CYAN|nr:FkbM family methyltransferase [Merismopedia glauca]PSB03810.1 hypothetical protein C7B64_06780 [Merismopedia glauca CCAP 1448/3]
MLIDSVGKIYRLLPSVKGKGFLARKIIAPLVRGKNLESVVEMRNPGGGKLICNLDDWIPWNVFIYGNYQVETSYELFMINRAKGCQTIFDIGANIGYYTIQFARVINGCVYSFEPMSYQFNTLTRNIALNQVNNITAIKSIVSDTNGVERIYFSSMQNTGLSSVIEESPNYEDVSAVSIDYFCQEQKIDTIDLIKIDVEGYELSVLKGMQQMLSNKQVKSLFVEINALNLRKAGTSPQEICSYLQQFGYSAYSIKSGEINSYNVGNDESLVYFALEA